MAREAKKYGLHVYMHINNRIRFPDDAPIFRIHPRTIGPVVQDATGGHILSTTDPLVQQYISDTISGLFRAIPELDGLMVIIGGEGFYHCYMHPYGYSKGNTDTLLCGTRGPEETVADLINVMSAAATAIRPQNDVVAWPYSAQFAWSRDLDQADFINRLSTRVSIATEVANSEVVRSTDDIVKSYWDHSIGLIGPSERAARQISLAQRRGEKIYLQSEPELSLEFSTLPYIQAPPRWRRRATAVAHSGANGVMSFPYFKPFFASPSTGLQLYQWWSPTPAGDEVEKRLAQRIAGSARAAALVQAWHLISEVMELSPEIPEYFHGPLSLGPAHPLMLDPDDKLPNVFYGQMLFNAEATEAQGLQRVPLVQSMRAGCGNLHRTISGVSA